MFCVKLIQSGSVCEVSRQKKEELLSQEEEKTQQQIFQGTMATEHAGNFDENSRKRGADYKGDNVLLQQQKQKS